MVGYLLGFLGFTMLCSVASAAYSFFRDKVWLERGYDADELPGRLLAVAVLAALLFTLAAPWVLFGAGACIALQLIRRIPKAGFAGAAALTLCQPFALVAYSFKMAGKNTAVMGASFGGPLGPLPSQLGESLERAMEK